ncbi:MAG TPA: class I SAM-dependent methyltransferase [Dehalococcoidia bacterium]|nr:class I SAM-dependent methyltransferase [Dehalococcoidia bacterium]
MVVPEVRKPSQSAVLTAVARELHRREAPPLALDDTLALALGGDDATRLVDTLERELSREALLAFSRWVCVRARVPEDVVARAVEDGVDQYVILGAGLDSFAYRRGDLRERLRIFEVDHPASQAWKRRRLEELGVALPPQLVFVPADFEHQTLAAALSAAAFDHRKRAVYSWIGVTMYLTVEAIRATLATIASGAPGTSVVLTYNRPPSALTGAALETEQGLRSILTGMGEPMISMFEPPEIEALVRSEGFDHVTHFGPEEGLRTYFPGREDVRLLGVQRIIIATVTAAHTV